MDAGIATLTLNRPDKRNAMSDDMRTEFIHALEHVSADKASFFRGAQVRTLGQWGRVALLG